MLKTIEEAAWFAALAFVIAFLVLTTIRASMSPDAQQEAQHQQQPTEQNRGANPRADINRHNNTDYWSYIKQQIQEQWNKFTNAVDNNDKVVVAISSIVVAVFTFVLAVVTILLFISAEKSAKIAEQALVAGQRAFISVAVQNSPVKSAATGKIIGWTFTPLWKNSGDTPTRNMVNHINRRWFDTPVGNDWDFPDLWSSDLPVEQRVSVPLGAAPKDAALGQALFVPIEAMNDVANNRKFLYMWGWAEYNDIFDATKLHVTRFAFQIVVGGTPTVPEQTSISYPNLTKYNCSDDECERQGTPAGWRPREMEL